MDVTLNFHEKTIGSYIDLHSIKIYASSFPAIGAAISRSEWQLEGGKKKIERERPKLVRARLAPSYRQFRVPNEFSVILKLLRMHLLSLMHK